MSTEAVLVTPGTGTCIHPGMKVKINGELYDVKSVDQDSFTVSMQEWNAPVFIREDQAKQDKKYQKVHGKHNGMSFPKKGRW